MFEIIEAGFEYDAFLLEEMSDEYLIKIAKQKIDEIPSISDLGEVFPRILSIFSYQSERKSLTDKQRDLLVDFVVNN